MATIKNLFYFIILNIINIKKYLSIVHPKSCPNDYYNSIRMDCLRFQVESAPCPNQNQIRREDGVTCFGSNPCAIGEQEIQKNYFGIFLNSQICSTKQHVINRLFMRDNSDYIPDDCNNENLLFCQQLLNLCALYLYLGEGVNYCETVNNKNILNNNMNLNYDLNDKNYITSKFSLKEDTINYSNYYLIFWVAKFYNNGTLLNFELLDYDFLQCSNSNDEKINYKIFGNNLKSSCFIDINKYLDESQNFFYEIFLEDNLYNSQKQLKRIPIKIIRTEDQLGNNQNDLHGRMFLHHYNEDENKFYYASIVKLFVETQEDNKEQIYIPHFEVLYKTLENKDNNIINYSFISEYKSDISDFMKAMKIVFIILTVIVGLLVIYRTYIWIKLNPSEIIENNYILLLLLEFIYKACKYLGKFYFWFTFGISAYWYFFYKIQFRVYFLMPPLNDDCYNKFLIIFYIGFCCYIIYMLIRIYKQISFDIFFIDWETEKNMAMNDIKSSLDKKVKYKKYRSAWRMIHVVNQFNELQKYRIFNLYFGFSWIILLYFRCDWERREHQVPRDAHVDGSPINLVLRNFIAGIIVMASVSVELVIVRLLQIWLPLKKQEFMDLCSVSNISVFILDELLHGYYIHGLSPIGKADVNYDELFVFLNHEGAGLMRNRGLENDNNEDHCKNQSYEMYISNVMRTIYDGLYIIQTESMLAKGVNARKYFKKSRLGNRLFKNFLNFEKDQTLLDNYMNNQLKSKIDIVTSNVIQNIKDKDFLQKILGYTINNNELIRINAPDIIFYRDYGQNFDDVLFCGMEWEWFIMDLFIFQMFMITTNDNYLSLFLTFIIDYLLYYIRVFFGNRNVAKKAVIDERFLS